MKGERVESLPLYQMIVWWKLFKGRDADGLNLSCVSLPFVFSYFSFIFSNANHCCYVPPSFFSLSVTLPASVHSLSRPWWPSETKEVFLPVTHPVFSPSYFKATIMHKQDTSNRNWILVERFIPSSPSVTSNVLTKVALIEIQVIASQPARGPWKPCERDKGTGETEKMRRESRLSPCPSAHLSLSAVMTSPHDQCASEQSHSPFPWHCHSLRFSFFSPLSASSKSRPLSIYLLTVQPFHSSPLLSLSLSLCYFLPSDLSAPPSHTRPYCILASVIFSHFCLFL